MTFYVNRITNIYFRITNNSVQYYNMRNKEWTHAAVGVDKVKIYCDKIETKLDFEDYISIVNL